MSLLNRKDAEAQRRKKEKIGVRLLVYLPLIITLVFFASWRVSVLAVDYLLNQLTDGAVRTSELSNPRRPRPNTGAVEVSLGIAYSFGGASPPSGP